MEIAEQLSQGWKYLHPTPNELEDYVLLGDKSESWRVTEQHVSACFECRKNVHAMRQDKLSVPSKASEFSWGPAPKLWINNDSYHLEPQMRIPTRANLQGLSFKDLLEYRERDVREPGAVLVGIETEDLAFITPLSSFQGSTAFGPDEDLIDADNSKRLKYETAEHKISLVQDEQQTVYLEIRKINPAIHYVALMKAFVISLATLFFSDLYSRALT